MNEGRKRAKWDLLAESKNSLFRSVTGNRDMTL